MFWVAMRFGLRGKRSRMWRSKLVMVECFVVLCVLYAEVVILLPRRVAGLGGWAMRE